MKTYIESTQLNKRLEAMGLKKRLYVKTEKHGVIYHSDDFGEYSGRPYDLLDLLEPKNAKKLWGEGGYRWGQVDDGDGFTVSHDWVDGSHRLLERYQNGEDWEKWLEEEIGEGWFEEQLKNES